MKIRKSLRKSFSESLSLIYNEYGDTTFGGSFQRCAQGYQREMMREVKRLLTLKIDELRYRGKSDLEKNLNVIGEMFDLTEQERRILQIPFHCIQL